MDYLQAERTTLIEYKAYMKAYEIKQEEKYYLSAVSAWFNQRAKATKGKGKNTRSAYSNFNDFYNHQEEFEKIIKGASNKIQQKSSIADLNKILNERG